MRKRAVWAGRILGALLAAPFGIYLGIIFGTFGGSWAERFLGRNGIPVGIILSVIIVSGTFVVSGALIGGGVGLLFARLFGRHSREHGASDYQ